MKQANLIGRYTEKAGSCHFADIPIFRKMADLGEQNNKNSSVNVCEVTVDQNIPLQCKVLRWKLVQNMNGQFILAYRTSTKKEKFPCLYRIVYDPNTQGFVLLNVTSCFSKFERLKKWYDNT